MTKKPRKISDEEFMALLDYFPEIRHHMQVLGKMCEDFLTEIRRVGEKPSQPDE